jgi:hypothetical protein
MKEKATGSTDSGGKLSQNDLESNEKMPKTGRRDNPEPQ